MNWFIMYFSAGQNRQRVLCAVILAAVFAVLGYFIAPAHWTSLWDDREFTDWVTPISNELHGQIKLYGEGMHSPMPPLPFVFVRLLFPNGAVWFDENLLNYLFQSAMVLLMFWAMARRFGPVPAFAGCLAGIPVIFSLQKTILYDAMAQFFVAASAMTAVTFARSLLEPANWFRHRKWWAAIAGLAFLLAAILLTKQSTGAGACIGVSVALIAVPRTAPFRRRVLTVALVGIATALCVFVLALAFSPMMSVRGMIQDVFLIGSEPKGGSKELLHGLWHITDEMLYITLRFACLAFLAYSVVTRTFSPRKFIGALRKCFIPGEGNGQSKPDSMRWAFAAFFIFAIAGAAACFYVEHWSAVHEPPASAMRVFKKVFDIGLLPGFFVAVYAAFARPARAEPVGRAGAPAIYAIIFIFSALFHNLSVAGLRWTYDNNPLVLLALAFFFHAVISAPKYFTAGYRWLIIPAQLLVVGAAIASLWLSAVGQIRNIIECTETWPEVAQLAGAKLRPQAEGMRSLVGVVRKLVDPKTDDTVLLLPNDPNVQAWFERKSPRLSCAIVFADQYWDRYVDRDFAELEAHPPKVIVIGPANFWRPFTREWKQNLGVERLIDLVSDKLLSRNYKLNTRQEIWYRDHQDFMDVYVRRETPRLGAP